MTKKKMTTQELADKTKIKKRTLDNYRSGRREPSLSKGVKIAEALGVETKRITIKQLREEKCI